MIVLLSIFLGFFIVSILFRSHSETFAMNPLADVSCMSEWGLESERMSTRKAIIFLAILTAGLLWSFILVIPLFTYWSLWPLLTGVWFVYFIAGIVATCRKGSKSEFTKGNCIPHEEKTLFYRSAWGIIYTILVFGGLTVSTLILTLP